MRQRRDVARVARPSDRSASRRRNRTAGGPRHEFDPWFASRRQKSQVPRPQGGAEEEHNQTRQAKENTERNRYHQAAMAARRDNEAGCRTNDRGDQENREQRSPAKNRADHG